MTLHQWVIAALLAGGAFFWFILIVVIISTVLHNIRRFERRLHQQEMERCTGRKWPIPNERHKS